MTVLLVGVGFALVALAVAVYPMVRAVGKSEL